MAPTHGRDQDYKEAQHIKKVKRENDWRGEGASFKLDPADWEGFQ